MLNAQRRKAERETDGEADDGRHRQHDEERHAGLERGCGDIGADAVERCLAERHLARVADRQVEAVRRHQRHAEERAQVDAVALQEHGKHREGGDGDEECHDLAGRPHTLRSSTLPSSPSGRTNITTRNSISATPSLYAGEM